MQVMKIRLIEKTLQAETKIRNVDDSDDESLTLNSCRTSKRSRKAGLRLLLY